ncbi:DUF7527 domain-containing protein [Haladaptatus sp. CMSO5]|uniref:DUF7527 domain-containing protein n=1 Tax=Haladaptatus sp. CMSO5 TaxID=3120514 RepID=UPI002FCDE70C
MDQTTVERIQAWDARSFAEGYRGLHTLADEAFSGAVSAGGAWLFMLNGRVVGIADGDIAAFEDATGTAYAAPHSSLPLLLFMQQADGETRAKYYTNDTPLREVDDQLTSGNFSGYIELSENVLSGDYYVVYYAGRAKSIAFVGNSGRMLTDDEAFDRAADEVGIYSVNAVDIDIIDLPEPSEPEPEPEPIAEPEVEEVSEPEAEPEPEPEPEPEFEADEQVEDPDSAVEDAPSEPAMANGGAESVEAHTDTEPEPAPEPESEPAPESATENTPDPLAEAASQPSSRLPRSEDRTPAEVSRAPSASSLSAKALETRSIPSLDPAKTEESSARIDTASSPDEQRAPERSRVRESVSERATGTPNAPPKQSAPKQPAPELEELKADLQNQKNEVTRLEAQLEQANTERDDLRAERDDLAAEVERLEAEVERLEDLLSQAEASGAAVGREQTLSPADALDGTNLFIRYHTKGKATLEKAFHGEAKPEEVIENLRIEHHTQFDSSSVAVNGEQFETFLTNTVEYRFVAWTIQTLLFEIADTRNTNALGELYEAIPKIDRAELNANVGVKYIENGEEHREQLRFDVVLRDRMGNPLVVANFNDSRDPATESMLASLVKQSTRVAETSNSLSAAFFVTTSFYEPEALETAVDAAGGGLLSRDKRKSFVKLSRKQGYHLCLVEARGGEFYMNVPEL